MKYLPIQFPAKILLIILLLVGKSIFALEKEKVVLEWNQISFAKEYLIELKDKKGKVFFQKKIIENKIEIELAPDDYEKRISVINKLGEIDAMSEWTPFLVRFAEGRIKVVQKWEKIPGAVSYIIEIKNEDGKIIQQRKTESQEIEIGLNPGNYQKRLVAINKLDEVEIESEWIPFQVIEIFKPELKDANKKEIITIEKKNPEIILDGIHFEEGIEIQIASNTQIIPIGNLKIDSENRIRMTLNIEDSSPGIYALKMKNRRSKESLYPSYLKLEIAKTKFLSKGLQNWEILLRSAVIPGWGQYYAGSTYQNSWQKKRGIGYGSLFLLGALYYIHTRNDFNKNLSSFERDANSAIAISTLIPEEARIERTLMIAYSAQKIRSNQTELQAISNQANNVSMVLLGIYLVQLVDAFIINRNINQLTETETTGFKFDTKRESISGNIQKPQENILFYYNFRF